MNVFLADLQNSYYRYIRNSVPLGMGYVAAYLEHVFNGDVEIQQFRKFEEIYEAANSTTPHLVALGSYSWNTALTLKTARFFRERFPDTLIAVGGPDVSELPAITFAELAVNDQVDFYLPNEGEGPTSAVIDAFLGCGDPIKVRGMDLPGVLGRQNGTQRPQGTANARFIGDINDIPSPYLDGHLDRFLDEIDYLPIIQTARGCPYQCTFCVSGKDSWRKVKPFDIERVKAEIDYVAERAANKYMRFADENFGILHRDVDVAEYLVEKREATGFPHSVSIYTDKHPTDRVKHINSLLSNMMPFNISYQSTTEEVLKNIKRINLTDKVVHDAVGYAREQDLTLVSELIFALPGESQQSYLDAIDKLIGFRFESIAMNQLRILKGSEMDRPADREKYQVETMFSMSENGYTDHEAMENVEIDEWVIANNTLSREEYFKINRLICLFDFAHFRSYLKELLFFFECYGVRATELLMRVLDSENDCPILAEMAKKFEDGIHGLLHETQEQVVEYVRKKMMADEPLVGIYVLEDRLIVDILKNDRLAAAIEEVNRVGTEIYRQRFGALPDEFEPALRLVSNVVYNGFIPLHRTVTEHLTIDSEYDLLSWVNNNYDRPLSEYKLDQVRTIGLNIRGIDAYDFLWSMDEDAGSKYERAFGVVNSSNRRRAMGAPADDAETAELIF